ncbi:hypothetical protein [Burkholderia sp. HI2714]|uniref:hypothetical protein n=1 Tax=Burkholderia sp. HI2714 TaxID=2015359 RepID=UPI00117DA5C6|nr:hypothetical protein [Burkholderia sp. HI2714]
MRIISKKKCIGGATMAAFLLSSGLLFYGTSSVAADFRSNYFGGLPERIDGNVLLKQIVNRSIFVNIDGANETLGTDAVTSLLGGRFTQIFGLVVKLGPDGTDNRAASFFMRTAGLYGNAPSIILKDSSGNYGYSGISAHFGNGIASIKFFGAGEDHSNYVNGTSFRRSLEDSKNLVKNDGGSVIFKRMTASDAYVLDDSATAVKMSVYVSPSSDGGGYILVTFNQAQYNEAGKLIFIGKNLTSKQFVYKVDGYTINQWMSLPVIASSSKSAFDGNFDAFVRNIPATVNPTDQYFGENESVILFSHLAKKPASREARGIGEDIWQCLSTFGLWCLERFGGAPTIDAPSHEMLVSEIVTSQPQRSNRTELTPYVSEEISPPRRLSNREDVQLAMDELACGKSDPSDISSPQECSVEDEQATSVFTNLSLNEMQSLRQALHDYADALQWGAAAAPIVNTGNGIVDQWVLQNPGRAEGLLDSLIIIARNSSAIDKPTTKGAVRNRKKAIKAQCVSNSRQEVEGEGWECVKKVAKMKGGSTERTGLPPTLNKGGVFYMSTDGAQAGNFNVLIREVSNSGLAPAGYTSENFRMMVSAIARDGAPAGLNRGVVYLMNSVNPNRHANQGVRFGFGIAHILSPGPTEEQRRRGITSGPDIGHREDWARLGVNNDAAGRALLARIIMAAISGSDAPLSSPPRVSSNGFNYARTYGSITIGNGLHYDTYTNIVIVIGSNGNVITAYPTRNSRKKSGASELR